MWPSLAGVGVVSDRACGLHERFCQEVCYARVSYADYVRTIDASQGGLRTKSALITDE